MNKELLEYLLPIQKSQIAVVANGEFPKHCTIIEYLYSSNKIIACDGAINNLIANNIIADYVIGDGDSSSLNQIGKFVKNPYIQILDQNNNDLSKAINFIQKTFNTKRQVIIFAASGLREDHALANIALLMQYAQRFSRIYMLSDHGIFQVCREGTHNLSSIIGQQISFFSLEDAQNNYISCQELKWPLVELKLDYLNNGTLNQAKEKQLIIRCTRPTLIFRAFEIKSN